MLLICPNAGVHGTSAATLAGGRFLRRGCRFGLTGRLLRVTAHHLLDMHRKRAPFLGTDQRYGEEGQPWHGLAVQTGKEPIQTLGVLTRFRDHDFIASQ
jgi:hypothetical protein